VTRLPYGRPRLRGLLGPDPRASLQTIVALLAALVGSVFAGVVLGATVDTLEALPGLLVLVPAATNLRGAIFGALGGRLGTAMHTGQFSLALRADTILGQNVLAAGAVSLVASLVLGVLAKVVAVGFGLAPTIGIADYVTISIAAGVAAGVVMTGVTVAVAAGGARFGWDLDNVTAPVVSATSDMVTLPLIFAATPLARIDVITPVLAWLAAIAGVVVFVASVRSHLEDLARAVRESVPLLAVSGLVSLVAGLAIEKRLDSLSEVPAVLVLVPPFLAIGGALVGILSSRLASNLHLGLIEPTGIPGREARRDIARTYALALPMFVLCAGAVNMASHLAGFASPGTLRLAEVALLGAAMAVTIAVGVAYAAGVLTFRLGLDPDNFGFPLVSSTMDVVGAFSLIVAVATFGVA
jgi:mgtE-like transporter